MIIDVWRPRYKGKQILYYSISGDIDKIGLSYVIRYKCDGCGNTQGVKYLEFKKTKNFNNQRCPSCIKSQKNKERYENSRKDYYCDFKKSVESKGYIMISEKEEYVNAKTKLEIICPDMHHFLMNKNNWKSGKRCFSCNKGYKDVNGKRKCNICGMWLDVDTKYYKNGLVCKKCRYVISQTAKEKEMQKVRNVKWRQSDKGRKNSRNRKLSRCISGGIRWSLRNNGSKNKRHWEELVDFTYDDIVVHLKSKFKEGMTLENHGKWHIDHIRPVSSFNFITPEDKDFKKCWSLDNLQPLWALENILKRDKWDGNINK